MASNLDYLDSDLIPLEEKVKAYLEAERQLQHLRVERETQLAQHQSAAPAFEQRSAAGSLPPNQLTLNSQTDALHDDLNRLRAEILALLPVRDAWVKVNLGYGPSRVGAFRTADAANGAAEYTLQVVQ